MHVVLAEILGPDLLIILVIVLLLFGGSQLPKLARSLGTASHEFRKGVEEGHGDKPADTPADTPTEEGKPGQPG
ncbi:MAG TPA: twin-arginine translocase TatA/TatE family subunit [Acidimicrobiales bacterium]|nr:twin-arginine translocase TatA/TatE family subunit [Acidimicrobiales bacterium]